MVNTASTLESRQVEGEPGATRVWIGGDGPPLVLLHGAGPGVDAEQNWSHVWDRLAASFHCIVPDMLGFGATELPAELPTGAAGWAQARLGQLIGLLDALEVDRAHVVGNSAGGGAVALRLLARHPERGRRIVLMGGAGTRLAPGARPAAFYDDPSPAAMERTIRRLILHPERAPRPLSEIAETRYAMATRPRAEEAFRTMHVTGGDPADDEAVLRAATLPVLLLHGAEDGVSEVEVSVTLREKLQTAHLHVVPDAGHWIHVDQPDGFCHLVESFLAERF